MDERSMFGVGVLCAVLSVSASAASGGNPPAPNPDKGNQGCYLALWPEQQPANPGKALQLARRVESTVYPAPTGSNPAQWVDWLNAEFGPYGYHWDNVGDWIDYHCGN